MTDIQYEGDENQYRSQAAVSESVGMAERLVRWGWVKDVRQANYLLIGIIIVCLLITAYLLIGGSAGSSAPLPPGAPGAAGGDELFVPGAL